MKKLMIALGAIAMAVSVQAAAVTWNWTSTCYDGWKDTGTYAAQAGTMYIFNANSITQQAVLDAFNAGSTISGYMDSYKTSDGKMASSAKQTLSSDSSTFTPVRDSSGTKYIDYFYAMVVDDNVLLTSTYSAQVQSAKDTSLASSLASPSKSYMGEETTFSDAGWYTAVPEPTSGLLLLLGMAGLALKRKRA